MLSVAFKSACIEGVTAVKVAFPDCIFGQVVEYSEDILGGLRDLRGWRDLNVSSTLFDIDRKLKRYVGSLVHFDGSAYHIAPLGFLIR